VEKEFILVPSLLRISQEKRTENLRSRCCIYEPIWVIDPRRVDEHKGDPGFVKILIESFDLRRDTIGPVFLFYLSSRYFFLYKKKELATYGSYPPASVLFV